MLSNLRKLGPGLLFLELQLASLTWFNPPVPGRIMAGVVVAPLLVNLFKYPFFQFGPRYALATGESLLDGYYKLGKIFLGSIFLNIATMFTIQTAVTVVTAGLASICLKLRLT